MPQRTERENRRKEGRGREGERMRMNPGGTGNQGSQTGKLLRHALRVVKETIMFHQSQLGGNVPPMHSIIVHHTLVILFIGFCDEKFSMSLQWFAALR